MVAQQRRVGQSFHSDGPVADARKIEEVRFRAWRDKQMIELEIKCEPCGSTHAPDPTRRKIDRLHLGLNKLDVADDAADRVDDVRRVKVSSGYLMQHPRGYKKILA